MNVKSSALQSQIMVATRAARGAPPAALPRRFLSPQKAAIPRKFLSPQKAAAPPPLKVPNLSAVVGNTSTKFKPRPITKKPAKTATVVGKVPRGASILIIQRPWIDLILDGYKTIEVRGGVCNKKKGERIYLALSGAGGLILGSAVFVACHGPFTSAEWEARGDQHCVAGEALPYGGRTHGWELQKPERFKEPVPYAVKAGCVVWALKD